MQLCNLHLVVCVNQSHHILKLARQWKFPICNACPRWALFQISFRPQQEIGGGGGGGGGNWGMGGQSIVGPLSRGYGNFELIHTLANLLSSMIVFVFLHYYNVIIHLYAELSSKLIIGKLMKKRVSK